MIIFVNAILNVIAINQQLYDFQSFAIRIQFSCNHHFLGPVSCQLFNGLPTTCLPIEECTWLQNAMNAITDFNTTIEEFSKLTLCNSTEEKILSVCCPQQSLIDLKTSIHSPPRKHTSENKLKKILLQKWKPAPTIIDCGKSTYAAMRVINGQPAKQGE